MTTEQAGGGRGRCWGCGYPLEGIPSRRCPECGRAFDPADPRTMNMRGPVNRVAAWLARRPLGRVEMALAAVATVLIAATTRWPVGPLDFSFADVRYFFAPERLAGFWRTVGEQAWTSVLFVGGIWIWALLVLWTALRVLVRWRLVRRHGRGVAFERVAGRRVVAAFGLLLMTGLFMVAGADYRLSAEWVGRALAARPGWPMRGISKPFDAVMSPGRQDDVLRCGMRRLSARGRMMATGIVVETRVERGLRLLMEAYAGEQDPDVRVVQLMLMSMYRDGSTAEVFGRAMEDAVPRVRATGADALGILHAPAYPIPHPPSWLARPQLETRLGGREGPRVSLDALVEYSITKGKPRTSYRADEHLEDQPIAVAEEYRQRLERMMLGGATGPEREAAARALLRWPPADYVLRVGEWGVWIEDKGDLKLAQSVLDEIPPFVHRIGNPRAEFAARVNPIAVITKPIVHVTASAPMVVDVSVEIDDGRPWFAYPLPDDLTVTALDFGTWERVRNPDGTLVLDAEGHPIRRPQVPTLGGLDAPAGFARFEPAGQGYLGVLPRHPKSGSIGGQMGSRNDISAAGVRWQSVIVSAELPAWAKLAVVPGEAKFGWWKQLREVESGYVTSRGETERFLYYDGPTNRKSPLVISKAGERVAVKAREVWRPLDLGWGGHSPAATRPQVPGFGRAGLFVRVRAGRATAMRVPEGMLEGAGERGFEVPGELAGEARALLMAMLLEGGLTASEAEGLVDAWEPQLLRTEGERVLVRFSSRDYDGMCPIRVEPAPTALVRVGLLLTELGRP